jgi:hypothetical protein
MNEYTGDDCDIDPDERWDTIIDENGTRLGQIDIQQARRKLDDMGVNYE